MTDRLLTRFEDALHAARRFRPGDDPFPVLEALGYALVLHVVDDLDAVPPSDRSALLALSARALAAIGSRASDGPDDAEAYAGGARLCELGLRLLAGEAPGPLEGLPADALDPTDARVARMLRGELDGLSAAACAVRCMKRRDPRPRLLRSVERCALVEAASSGAEPIRLAAADAAPVRAPDEGRLVATLEDTFLEAVYFPEDHQLAVYAASPVFLQVVAHGLTPRDVKPGYWLGDVRPGTGPLLELEVRMGERIVRWGVAITG